MRILVVSQYFWPENFRVNELTASLVERGHEVTVLTGLPNYPEGKIFKEFVEEPSRYADFGGARVLRVPMIPRGNSPFRLMLNYVSFALSASVLGPGRLRGRGFDVIFVFETSPVTVGIPSSLLRAWLKAPVVFWVLDQWPETLKAVGVVRSRRILSLVALLVRWIYRRCDLVLSQSKSLIPVIRSYCDGKDKVRYFPNWSDVDMAEGDVEPAGEIPLAPGVFTVLYAGNIGEAQDFPAVLRAMELVREDAGIRWVIVGEGRAAAWLTGEIEKRGLSGRVLLPGRFPPERMASVYRHADALLVSLRADPLFAMTIPGKLQTYLGVGLPILAMLDGEGGNVVQEAGAGIVCPAGDAVGLAGAVRRLATMEPAERRDIGNRAKEYSLREFDRRRLLDRLEVWFEELVPRVPGQGVLK